ncbi:DUF4862 family protein [Arthrobacter sp. FW306-2-2C-D06B]|uniref:DUF4862 family protein n=1 Tax=Arthrobacter sp. FW306-2-2C-D06B TaxID=2879618 RepID=UPI001F32EE33|nr:DUF4862 family protein [Arthrobacter sp. FW306-2-2C-D06B]UKA60596.1 DUF4862 family protein [Arthrobacter sp. FW306-2-2C-D06B]
MVPLTSPERTPYFIGAYAAAPSLTGWDPVAEGKFLASVFALDDVAGLEIPFSGKLHKEDEAWFLRQLPEDACFVVTTIPGTMARVQADQSFGLASTSASGRRSALDFVQDALESVKRLNRQLGRPAVVALELHAAPVAARDAASAAALEASLTELAGRDTAGARLVLEHCDALIPDQAPAKGFLTLEAEAEAVQRAGDATGHPFGMVINWGRSVIEQRRPEAGHEHITYLRERGLLGGVVLSGCSSIDTRYGPAWADVHVPPAPPESARSGASDPTIRSDGLLEPGSLLTIGRIEECLRAAGPLSETGFRAIKVAAPPNASVEQRVMAIAQTLAVAQQPSRNLPA